MTDSSDYSALMPHIADAFQRYYQHGHAMLSAEMMKRDRETGDVSMETVNIVLLDPTSYQFLHAMIPLLHDPTMQVHLLHVIEETLVRAKKAQEDKEEDGPT